MMMPIQQQKVEQVLLVNNYHHRQRRRRRRRRQPPSISALRRASHLKRVAAVHQASILAQNIKAVEVVTHHQGCWKV